MELAILILLAAASLGVLTDKIVQRRSKFRKLGSEDAAFDEHIAVPPDPKQLRTLRPLIDRVGIMTRLVEGGRGYEVFVIDIQGAVHDLPITFSLPEVIELVDELVKELECPFEDEEGILEGRGEGF